MEDDDKSPILLDNDISNLRIVSNAEQFAPDSLLAADLEPNADIESTVVQDEGLVAELDSAAAIETDVVPDGETAATDRKCDFDDANVVGKSGNEDSAAMNDVATDQTCDFDDANDFRKSGNEDSAAMNDVATDQTCDFDDANVVGNSGNENSAAVNDVVTDGQCELIGDFDGAEAVGISECSMAVYDVDVINEEDEIRVSVEGDKCGLIGDFDGAEAGGNSECSTAVNEVDVIKEEVEIRVSVEGDKCGLIGDIDSAEAVRISECSTEVNDVGVINEEIPVIMDGDKCEDFPKLEELEPVTESRMIVNEDEHMGSQVLQREDVHMVDGLEPLIEEVGIDAKQDEFEDNEDLLNDDVSKADDLETLNESRIDGKEGEVEDIEVVKEEEEIIEGVAELEHLQPVGEGDLDVKEEDVEEEVTFTMMSEHSVSGLATEAEEVKSQMEVVETELCAANEDEDGDMATVGHEIGEDDDKAVEEHEISTLQEKDDDDMLAEEHEIPTLQEKDDEEDDMPAEEHEIPTLQEKDVGDDDMLAEEDEIPTLQEKDDEDDDMLAEEHKNPIQNENEVDEDHENPINREAENEGIVAEVPTEKEDEEMGDEEHEVHTEKENEDGDEQETPTTETEVRRGSGKQRRGRTTNVTTRASARKTVEEDVCFICFDGGDLVLCDRRGCPKAYHPSCVNRDEEFFQAKGRWNCGWHLCSICEKNANYMCYTCTFSLCKSCTKDAVIKCVRGNKGFCETCMKTVMLIERNELGKDETVNFNDKSSWEYLFKDYWSDLKGKLTLSLDEVAQAKNPWKGSDLLKDKQGSPVELYDPNNENGSGSDNPSGNKGSTPRKRKAPKKRVKPIVKEEDSESASDNSENLDTSRSKKRKGKRLLKSRAKRGSSSAEGSSGSSRSEWASKELLEFVMHMKDGDSSVLSQFDVQALLLDYIKRNKLRDPRRKSQIICDMRLQNLFGKQRVGHFEMLKLLESHFLIREDSQADDLQGIVVDTDTSNLDIDDALTKASKGKKRKARRKGDRRALQDNVDDYAAIDTHNINLVYLKRNVMEALLEDLDYFYDKVIGSFVRIRISGSSQKQEMYRLVQVVGTSKADEPYKVVKRTTNIILEIQNLNKKEVISMDIISNQDFTEDECKRLRQSIKCGLINRLTLGDIQEKAMALQEARVNDWLEAEVLRLSHLSDRASDTGRRKELRECVEKIQVLKTPEERQRRLEEIPEIHTDPKMDPSYESEEEEGEPEDTKQDSYLGSRSTSFSRRGSQPISPRTGTPVSNDSWSGTRISPATRELSRNMSGRSFSNRREDVTVTGNLENENTWTQERYKGSTSEVLPETSPPSLPVGNAQDTEKVNETEKTWLYRDPSGKVQGPFSITQLRKWNNTGYFPKDLKIWKSTENQDDDSIFLTNALNGNFQKALAPHLLSSYTEKLNGTTFISSIPAQGIDFSKGSSALSVETPKLGTNGWNSNLPSPTPNRASENNMSPTPPSAGFAQQIKNEHNVIERSGVMSTSISDSLRQLIQQGSEQGLSSLLLPNASSTIQPEQGTSSQNSIQYQAGGQVNQSADTGNLVQSGTSYNTDVSQGWSSGSVVATQNVEQSNHGNPVQQQPGYSQWGPPAPVNQAIVQPNAGWGPMPGNPNMSWGAMPPQGNVNMNWGATAQGPAPQVWPTSAPEVMNPNWATSAQGQPSGNPNPNWVATGPAPAPGNTNPGWGPSGPGQPPNWAVPGNGNPWVAPVPGNLYPGWVPSNQGPPPPVNPSPNWAAPPNANSGWIAPNQVPAAPANTNPGWVTPNQAPGPTNPNANAGWGTPNQAPAPTNTNSGWGTPNQTAAPANANAGWTPQSSNSGPSPGIRGNDPNRNGDRNHRDSRNNPQGGNGRGWNRGGGDSSSSRPRGNRVCDFYLNGHCKKGSNCDRVHPP